MADDQTELHLDGGDISMTAPATIAGRIEVRGLGIMRAPFVATAPLRLVVDLVAPAAIERMPERRRCALLGQEVPLVALAPFEASAVAKLRLALDATAGSTTTL